MAEISTGTRTDVSSRDVPVRKDDAIFSTVKTMTGNTDGSVGVLYLTGSLAGSSGFWPPWFISEPPKKTVLQILKNEFVSP